MTDVARAPDLAHPVYHQRMVVAPRDARFGRLPLVFLPETPGEAVSGAIGAGAPPHIYALPDAARIDGLPERLAAIGVVHDCLDRSAARDASGL